MADEFLKGARKAMTGVQIIAKEFTSDKATDFSAILTTIKAKKTDLIFLGGMDSVAGLMHRLIKALDVRVKLMGGASRVQTRYPSSPAPQRWRMLFATKLVEELATFDWLGWS